MSADKIQFSYKLKRHFPELGVGWSVRVPRAEKYDDVAEGSLVAIPRKSGDVSTVRLLDFVAEDVDARYYRFRNEREEVALADVDEYRCEGSKTDAELVAAVDASVTAAKARRPAKPRPAKATTAECGAKLSGPWSLVSKLVGSWPYALLYGVSGTGKTHTVNKLLKASAPRTVNCYITPETTAAEIMGYSAPDETGTFRWRDGPVTSAMRAGLPLVINEIDDVAGDAETALLGALDDPGVAQYELMSGETLRPAKGFSVVATMNGTPDMLRPALLDRLPYRFEITEVHPDAIARLPEDLQEAARRTTDPNAGGRRQSIRAWIAYAEAREQGLTEDEAANAVWGVSARDVLNVLKMCQAER